MCLCERELKDKTHQSFSTSHSLTVRVFVCDYFCIQTLFTSKAVFVCVAWRSQRDQSRCPQATARTLTILALSWGSQSCLWKKPFMSGRASQADTLECCGHWDVISQTLATGICMLAGRQICPSVVGNGLITNVVAEIADNFIPPSWRADVVVKFIQNCNCSWVTFIVEWMANASEADEFLSSGCQDIRFGLKQPVQLSQVDKLAPTGSQKDKTH